MEFVNVREAWAGQRALLFTSHPGHELRIHGWLETARPDVMVLTDGSGGTGVSRLSSTERVLAAAGCQPSAVLGEFTDRRVYELILTHRFDGFLRVVDRLVAHVRAFQIQYIVSDAADGMNPAHDLCRLLVAAAWQKLSRHHGLRLSTYSFRCSGPLEAAPQAGAGDFHLSLDDDCLRRKLQAIHDYRELRDEVRVFENRSALDSIRHEYFSEFAAEEAFAFPNAAKPFYEMYGEQQVARRRYREVLRRDRHMRPLADTLWRYATVAHRHVA